MTEFEESGMRFSFDDDSCYRIEKDEYVLRSMNLKACECAVSIGEVIVFIEAKTSVPRKKHIPSDIVIPEGFELLSDFEKFFVDVSQKFIDSHSFVSAVFSHCHPAEFFDRIPDGLKSLQGTRNVDFVLVVKNAESSWLPPLNDSLKKYMRHYLKAWNVDDARVKVMNMEMARRKRYIM